MPSLSRRAEKDLAALPDALRIKAESIIARLDAEPGIGKKLVAGLKGIRSARLGRSHRILYEIRPDGMAHVLTVGQRRDIYR
jgi:mRNA-degrading endonuclease RelE of RelBE toxin-antitoxin system